MRLPILLFAWLAAAPLAEAQTVPFAGSSQDTTQPVEITADKLELDQGRGTAVFSGSVRAAQGALRLAADRMEVFYRAGGAGGTEGGTDAGTTGATAGAIDRIRAEGNVTLSNGTEAAEAEQAVYDVAAGTVAMEGKVLLTQGGNAVASERLRLDLRAGTGVLDGRVQTIFVPGTTPGSAPGTKSP